MPIYIQNVKNPNVRFEVLAYDKTTGMGKIKGELGAEFTRDISKPALEKYGYAVVKSDKPLPLSAVAQKPKPSVGVIAGPDGGGVGIG
jgi:hypothetical protein